MKKLNKDKRFIEESFPVKEVSIESAREKNIRHGHICALHIWWARRPLASSRATSYAALIPTVSSGDKKEFNKKRNFIIEFSKWENSLNHSMIEQARKDILKANNGKPPKVLDPFGGGGAIPLEALRLGCETYSNDYSPVAVLIQKCTLEYPQKYGKPFKIKNNPSILFPEIIKQKTLDFDSKTVPNRLLYDVEKWSSWVLKETKREIGKFYPPDPDGSIPVGYIWARTIPCQNPSCGAEIPLMRQFWLSKKKNKNVSLFPYIKDRKVFFRIIGDAYEKIPEEFDPSKGTVARAIAICPVCGGVIDAKTTRKLFQEGKADQRMIAVVLHHPKKQGKTYRIAKKEDLEFFKEAEIYLKEKRVKLMDEWGIDPVPDELIHTPNGKEYTPGGLLYNFTPVVLYNMTKWGNLFNVRQKLALITFTEKVRLAYKKMIVEGHDEEYAKALVSYLALGVDRLANRNSQQNVWNVFAEKAEQVFLRQALPMLWDYCEINSCENQGWKKQFSYILHAIKPLSTLTLTANIRQSSAISQPYQDNYFDAVFTDPPYYDNVPYADLSDFFYVWLKRTIGNLYPELFSTPNSPKSNEIIAELPLLRGMKKEEAALIIKGIKTKENFEKMLKKSFQEIYRVLKPNGIATIVYAHKSAEGWETLINSLIYSGLVVTASWPINTEMKKRPRAQESAALASSIYIITRKIKREPTGFYNNIKEELKTYLYDKLERLWSEGISGADFFISAIGSAIEIFGKYQKIIDYEGNIIRASQMLSDVRRITTDYAVHQILHNGFAGDISNLTRFYVLYRWSYGEAKLHFDEARKLSTSANVALEKEWNRPSFIKKEKEFIRVLGPQDRKFEDFRNSSELVDVLHAVLLLWEKGRRNEIVALLEKSGYGKSDAFYRVAQTISETLPNESKEKKLLDGFLSGKMRLQEEIKIKTRETRINLFNYKDK
jgi:adenine-specific DNA methylase